MRFEAWPALVRYLVLLAIACTVDSTFQLSASRLAQAGPVQLYWTDSAGILTANTTDRIVHDFVTDMGRASSVHAAGGDLYWTRPEHQQLIRTPLDGGPSTVLHQAPPSAQLSTVAVDLSQGKLYWDDTAAKSITRANLDASDPQVVVSTDMFHTPYGMSVDSAAQRMYWYTSGSGGQSPQIGLFSANTDGSNATQLQAYGGGEHIYPIRIDHAANKLYWGSFHDDSIQRANLDGTEIEPVLTGLRDPIDLVVVPIPEPATVVLAGTGLAAWFLVTGRRRGHSASHRWH